MTKGVTVQEVLATKGFQGSRVVAGEKGLGNIVKTITVAEVPDAMDWLRGGELVVTTAFFINENNQELEKWVTGLASHEAIAIAIKPERFIGYIPDKIINIGNEYNIPVIELPMSVTWPTLIESVMNLILDHQAKLLKESENIHNSLTKLVLESKGLDAIAKTISQLAGNPVIIEDRWFNVLATACCKEENHIVQHRLSEKYLDQLRSIPEIEAIYKNKHKTFVRNNLSKTGETYGQYIFPVFAGNKVSGFLSLIEVNKMASHKDFITLEHGSTVIALELLKRKATFEAEGRLRADLLRALLEESNNNEEEVRQKAAALGLNLGARNVVMVIKVINKSLNNLEEAKSVKKIDFRICNAVNKHITSKDPEAFVIARHNDFVVFFHSNNDDRLEEYFANLSRRLNQELDNVRFIIGLGSFYNGIKDIKRSYMEATAAVNIGQKFPHYGSVLIFSKLGFYRLLSLVNDRKELESYCRDIIGPLIEYQESNQVDLLSTLESYILFNGNKAKVARSMFMHVNTVSYRIKKIEKLLNIDISHTENIINIYLAIKIYKSL